MMTRKGAILTTTRPPSPRREEGIGIPGPIQKKEDLTASIAEIFSSIQGEGPHTGEKQIFVRFAGCPLRCDYCDTPDSLVTGGHPKMTSANVMNRILVEHRSHGISMVSLTGGEPLVQLPFLKELLPLIKKEKLSVYLETAGVHPEPLRYLVDFCDVVAMDIKLPSATGKAYWGEHKEFLRIGRDKIFCKIVLEAHTPREEVEMAISLLANRSNPPLVVLQPVTSINESIQTPDAKSISEFYTFAKTRLVNVLVMPQHHKLWNIR